MEERDYTGQMVQMVISLGGIILIVSVCAYFFKRLIRKRLKWSNDSHAIKILDKRPLSPKTTLHIIEVGGKRLLIGESASSVHCLSELPVEADLREVQKATFSFSSLLKQKFKVPS